MRLARWAAWAAGVGSLLAQRPADLLTQHNVDLIEQHRLRRALNEALGYPEDRLWDPAGTLGVMQSALRLYQQRGGVPVALSPTGHVTVRPGGEVINSAGAAVGHCLRLNHPACAVVARGLLEERPVSLRAFLLHQAQFRVIATLATGTPPMLTQPAPKTGGIKLPLESDLLTERRSIRVQALVDRLGNCIAAAVVESVHPELDRQAEAAACSKPYHTASVDLSGQTTAVSGVVIYGIPVIPRPRPDLALTSESQRTVVAARFPLRFVSAATPDTVESVTRANAAFSREAGGFAVALYGRSETEEFRQALHELQQRATDAARRGVPVGVIVWDTRVFEQGPRGVFAKAGAAQGEVAMEYFVLGASKQLYSSAGSVNIRDAFVLMQDPGVCRAVRDQTQSRTLVCPELNSSLEQQAPVAQPAPAGHENELLQVCNQSSHHVMAAALYQTTRPLGQWTGAGYYEVRAGVCTGIAMPGDGLRRGYLRVMTNDGSGWRTMTYTPSGKRDELPKSILTGADERFCWGAAFPQSNGEQPSTACDPREKVRFNIRFETNGWTRWLMVTATDSGVNLEKREIR